MNEKSRSQIVREALSDIKSREAAAQGEVTTALHVLLAMAGPELTKAITDVVSTMGILSATTESKLGIERAIEDMAELEKMRNKFSPTHGT